MAQLSAWWGAGVLTAGVSAALLTGAGAAAADTGADTGATNASAGEAGADAGTASERERSGAVRAPDPDRNQDRDPVRSTGRRSDKTEPRESRYTTAGSHEKRTEARVSKRNAAQAKAAGAESAPDDGSDTEHLEPPTIPVIGDILGPFQPDYPPLVRTVGSAIFNLLGTVVQAADGSPVVPPDLRDSVRVSSSGLVIAPGHELAADWYFPTEGGQPQRLVYLQHGILATGPMYSYTAAYLAERTNSVVVATTITSNPFAGGGMWLGGDNMHHAVAQLFLDDNRAALTASLTTAALKVGAPTLSVPREVVIVGHSLGGGFAPGVAGHYAEALVARRADGQNDDDAANHLAGVVMLDGVPFVPILPNAMDRLTTLEDSNDGDRADFVPVYEIGAPQNFLNAFSAVNDELSEARPGMFNGVVINGGVHMDGMLGGNPLIQGAAYLVAGIPQRQNPSAVQLLMAGWINDMFDGTIDPVTGRCLGAACQGHYGEPGETIVIPSGHGTATAVAIGSGTLPVIPSLRADHFHPLEASSPVSPRARRSAAL
jgi:hypothetical protein